MTDFRKIVDKLAKSRVPLANRRARESGCACDSLSFEKLTFYPTATMICFASVGGILAAAAVAALAALLILASIT